MNNQTKLIIKGAAIIGGGVLLYYLLKPKKSKLEKLTGISNQQIMNDLKNQINYNKAAAQRITGGAQWVPTESEAKEIYTNQINPPANFNGTASFIKTNPYG